MNFRSLIRILALSCLALQSQGVHAGAYEDMLHAIRTDDQTTIIDLLRRGVDIETVSPQGETLLMLAAREGKPIVIETLLAAKPRINARNPLGETALMLAAIQGHTEAVKMLIAAGAPVNQSGWTPLIYAAARDRVDIAKLLIAKGANVNAAADNGTTALMMAAREGYLQMLLLLLES
ncbi:MAG: ankyrin repeat domain-containing protein [Burkholderiales bacterium]